MSKVYALIVYISTTLLNGAYDRLALVLISPEILSGGGCRSPLHQLDNRVMFLPLVLHFGSLLNKSRVIYSC